VPDCRHAHPIIKSSHVATFSDQFLPRISSRMIFVFDRRDKFEQPIAEMKGICCSATLAGHVAELSQLAVGEFCCRRLFATIYSQF
jgi:DNA-directed RNA polymerase subunit N (RpoN/RPB10)